MFPFNFAFPVAGLVGGIIALLFGILILAFPRILNYLVGIALILGGIGGIMAGSWLVGIISLIFGIMVMIIPRILNYLVAIYLIIIGLTYIFTTGFAMVPLITGILFFIFGIMVLVNPATLNVIVGIAFIIQGIIAIAQYYRWF